MISVALSADTSFVACSYDRDEPVGVWKMERGIGVRCRGVTTGHRAACGGWTIAFAFFPGPRLTVPAGP